MIDVIFYRLGSMRIFEEINTKSVVLLRTIFPFISVLGKNKSLGSSEISQHPPAHLSRWI